MAQYWSGKSRNSHEDEGFLGEDKEWQVIYAKEVLQQEHVDYFVFGHRHIRLELPIGNSMFYNIGDWMTHHTYLEFDGDLSPEKYDQ